MLCAEVYREPVATCELLVSSMAAIRSVQMSARPFDSNQLVYHHCIDLSTIKEVCSNGRISLP